MLHTVLRFPKVGVPSCLLRNVRNSQLQVKGRSCFPPKGLGSSAQRGEMLQQYHGKEQRFPQKGKVQIFGLFFKYFNWLMCFDSTQFVAFVLLGWEMVIWDLERICVPE